MPQPHRVRVFVSLRDFGFTTEVDEPTPDVCDGLNAVARAVARYNEWFVEHGSDRGDPYRLIVIDGHGCPFLAFEHIVLDGGRLLSFENHLDLDAERTHHGMDPDRCEACCGNVVAGKICYACGLTGPTGDLVPHG